MLREGMCEDCPGNDDFYVWDGESTERLAAVLCFYAVRRAYQPGSDDLSMSRMAAIEAMDRVGIPASIQAEAIDGKPFSDGIACSKSFYANDCDPDQDVWMEDNDNHDPRYENNTQGISIPRIDG